MSSESGPTAPSNTDKPATGTGETATGTAPVEARPEAASGAKSETSPEAKPAPKKAAKAEGEAAEAKKPKAPEPEVKPEDMADANALFKKIFELVEVRRHADRAVVEEVERGHARLLQRVATEAKDMAVWEKKVLKALTEFGNAAQLGGGEAKLQQLHNKLWSIRELLDDARKLG
jgi:hypothetical protein